MLRLYLTPPYIFVESYVIQYRQLYVYLLTSWSRVLLEKQIGSEQVKKFPTFYETSRFMSHIHPVHATIPLSEAQF